MVSFLDGGGTSHLISKLLDTMYPVGSIYMSVNNTSPAAIFGGTWKRIANGRTLMGVDSADEDFSTPAHTGGAKEVTHAHHTPFGSEQGANKSWTAMWDQRGSTKVSAYVDNKNKIKNGYTNELYFETYAVKSPYHFYVMDGETSAGSATATIGATYSTTMPILPPYTTVYIWQRLS